MINEGLEVGKIYVTNDGQFVLIVEDKHPYTNVTRNRFNGRFLTAINTALHKFDKNGVFSGENADYSFSLKKELVNL